MIRPLAIFGASSIALLVASTNTWAAAVDQSSAGATTIEKKIEI
jgi:hypothetical protein